MGARPFPSLPPRQATGQRHLLATEPARRQAQAEALLAALEQRQAELRRLRAEAESLRATQAAQAALLERLLRGEPPWP